MLPGNVTIKLHGNQNGKDEGKGTWKKTTWDVNDYDFLFLLRRFIFE